MAQNADKGGEGVQNPENLADVICERPLTDLAVSDLLSIGIDEVTLHKSDLSKRIIVGPSDITRTSNKFVMLSTTENLSLWVPVTKFKVEACRAEQCLEGTLQILHVPFHCCTESPVTCLGCSSQALNHSSTNFQSGIEVLC